MEHGRASDLSILTRLAVGGMAEIFLARKGPMPDGHLVVVKRILPQYAEEGRFLRMLFDEATISAQLAHPNIVKVHGLSRGGEEGYSLIMEYVPGETVARLLRACRATKKTIPLPICAYIAEQVAGALHYAHDLQDGRGMHLGLVHRDVTPGNVMISDEGAVKVLDFGIARAEGRFDKTASSDIRKGTLGYMSPEYYRHGDLDRRADVFSLGVVLYEMMTMTHPFEAPNEMAMVQRILKGDIKKLEKVLANVPSKLATAVDNALLIDPDKRYQTAAELQKALRVYLDTLKPQPGKNDLIKQQHEHFSAQIEARKKLSTMPPPATQPVETMGVPSLLKGNAVSWSNINPSQNLDQSMGDSSEVGASTNTRTNTGFGVTSDRHDVPDADEVYDDATVVQDPMDAGSSNLSFMRAREDAQKAREQAARRQAPSEGPKILIDEDALTGQQPVRVPDTSPAPLTVDPQQMSQAVRKGTPRDAKSVRRARNRQILIAAGVGGAVLVVGILLLLVIMK